LKKVQAYINIMDAINITPDFRILPDETIFNQFSKETDKWESFVKGDDFSSITLAYSQFAKSADKEILRKIIDYIKKDQNIITLPADFLGIIEIILDIFNEEFKWRDDVEVNLKERSQKRFKKDYTSLHISADNGSIIGMEYLMKNIYSRIKHKWITIGDPDNIPLIKKERYIIGPKKGELSIGNLRSVSNQIKIKAKKLHFIYCGIIGNSTEVVIYILYSIILARKKTSVICKLPDRMSSSILSAIHMFSMCFEHIYIKNTYIGAYLIGRNFIEEIINKKTSDNIYKYLTSIINNPDIIFPIYKNFDFVTMNNFIKTLKTKLNIKKDIVLSQEHYMNIISPINNFPKNLSKCIN